MSCLWERKHAPIGSSRFTRGRRHSKWEVCLPAILIMIPAVRGGPGFAESLRRAAQRTGMLVGAAVDSARLSEKEYASTLAREFNMAEPENGMKWSAIRPKQETFDFTAGDQVAAFARAHRMKLRGHTLLWGDFNPDWLAKGQFTPPQLSRILRQHIRRVMGHYRGRVFAWDVVNEAFDDKGKLQSSIWYDKPGIGLAGRGTAYIERAFRWARAADRHALLFYNDWGAEGLNPKSDAIYAMVRDFKRRRVPIDGVGLQTHVFSLNAKELASLAANLKRLAALGVQVQVTEMDAGISIDKTGAPANPPDLKTQAEIYRQVAEACVNQRRCTAFQTWGVTDKYTWITGWSQGKKGAPLLFDAAYRPKRAYQAVLDAFRHGRRRGGARLTRGSARRS